MAPFCHTLSRQVSAWSELDIQNGVLHSIFNMHWDSIEPVFPREEPATVPDWQPSTAAQYNTGISQQ